MERFEASSGVRQCSLAIECSLARRSLRMALDNSVLLYFRPDISASGNLQTGMFFCSIDVLTTDGE